jgi:GYF domain 2
MSDDWYYAKGGQRFGPFTFEQFKHLADSGLLLPDDMVGNENTHPWLSAREIDRLFSRAGPRDDLTPNSNSPHPLEPAPENNRRVTGVPSPAVLDRGTLIQVKSPLTLVQRWRVWIEGLWLTGLVAADVAILHFCIYVWFGLNYGRILWFPTMALAVLVAALAFALASLSARVWLACELCCSFAPFPKGRPDGAVRLPSA